MGSRIVGRRDYGIYDTGCCSGGQKSDRKSCKGTGKGKNDRSSICQTAAE